MKKIAIFIPNWRKHELITRRGSLAEMTPVAVMLSVIVFNLIPRSVAILSPGLEILPTLKPPHPIRKTCSIKCWSNSSFVTIQLIGWFNVKTLRRIPEANNSSEIMKISTEMYCWSCILFQNSRCSCIQKSIRTTKTIC